jgi:hypothetical protein
MLDLTVLPEARPVAEIRMEINPIRRQIEDLGQRTAALRGYL